MGVKMDSIVKVKMNMHHQALETPHVKDGTLMQINPLSSQQEAAGHGA